MGKNMGAASRAPRQDRNALDHWREQETAFLADFVPLQDAATAAAHPSRFVAGWWLLPSLVLSLGLWGAILAWLF